MPACLRPVLRGEKIFAQVCANQRKAFDRNIAGFQVARHKLVDMAKSFSAEVCENVTREAVQIFGRMGYMREYVVECLYRDAKLLSIGGGTTEVMKELIAKQIKLQAFNF